MENLSTMTQEKSTHMVEVFLFKKEMLRKHDNADTLSVITIPETSYTYVAKTEDWIKFDNNLIAFIPPDSIVDVKRPEFTFLGEKGSRVKAKKLRGIVSYGLLIPLSNDCGLKPGDNAASFLGVTHYDPEIAQIAAGGKGGKKNNFFMGGEVAKSPSGVYPQYDIDSGMKYAKRVLTEWESVYISEKIHGSNSSFLYQDGEMHCRSHYEWKKEFSSPPKITLEELTEKVGDAVRAKEIYEKAVINFKARKNMWWEVLDRTPTLRKFCEAHPGWCIYGEIYGQVKGFPYDRSKEDFGFRAFDILLPATDSSVSRWLNAEEFMKVCDEFQVSRVPLISCEPFNFEKCLALAEGNSLLNENHIREGIVIKPVVERWNEKIGRVILKIVSPKYLEHN